jgi:hypothetical protein
MCGPSSATKAINSSIQDFAGTVKSQAGDVFTAASSVFNGIMDSVKGIVSGGPSQFGYSAGEYSAKTAAAVNAGAAEARNLKGAAASSAAAIGGGNVATPAGMTQAATMAADQKAAADTAATENEILQSGFETGRQNYNNAVKAEEGATEVFNPATSADSVVTGAQKEAMTSQTQIDQASNWAMNDVMKLGTAAVSSFASGGFGALTKMIPKGGGGGGGGPVSSEYTE